MKRIAALLWSLLLLAVGLVLFPVAVAALLVASAWRAAMDRARIVETWRSKVRAGQRP